MKNIRKTHERYNAAVNPFHSPPRAAVLALCATLVACSQEPPRPDLGRLYRTGSEFADTTPVILIPGLFGSRLRDRVSGIEVWPGSTQMILFDEYRRLALEFDPATLQVRGDDLEASGITDEALGRDFYGQIIEALQKFGGYVRGDAGTPALKGERRYYIYSYDWRQDNVEAARGLDRLIEKVRRDYGDPALRVDVIAHSMGGLIARYYLRYGPIDVLDGSEQMVTLYGTSRVRKLILLGTPNMGSASSLHAYLTGEPVGLRRIPPEVLATLPSGYQLFPHPLVTWLIDTSGAALSDDLFDGAIWRRYRWSIFDPAVEARIRAQRGAAADSYIAALRRFFDYRLERARRFLWALSTPEPATPIRYVLFRRLHADASQARARGRSRRAERAPVSR